MHLVQELNVDTRSLPQNDFHLIITVCHCAVNSLLASCKSWLQVTGNFLTCPDQDSNPDIVERQGADCGSALDYSVIRTGPSCTIELDLKSICYTQMPQSLHFSISIYCFPARFESRYWRETGSSQWRYIKPLSHQDRPQTSSGTVINILYSREGSSCCDSSSNICASHNFTWLHQKREQLFSNYIYSNFYILKL